MTASDNTGEVEWSPVVALPNVRIETELFESDLACIVSSRDTRVQQLASKHPAFLEYMGRFENQFGDPIRPAMMLVRKGIPPQYVNSQAVGGFRDIAAITTMPYARAQRLKDESPKALSYTNPFQFYPWMLGKDYGADNVAFSSGTAIVPPGAKGAYVWVWGGGGSGGSINTTLAFCQGGAGGGFSMGFESCVPGETATITVGAGGAAIAGNGTGNTGGTSSFAVAAKTVSATGGAGGATATSNGVASATAAGGVGSNDDFNYTGGTSASVTPITAKFMATGGSSAAGPWGNGQAAGVPVSINPGASGGASIGAASGVPTSNLGVTGGAGLKGASGSATTGASGGGAAFAPSPAAAAAAGVAGKGSNPGVMIGSIIEALADGAGGAGSITDGTPGGNGQPGGGGGAACNSSTGSVVAGDGGFGAGGGGATNNSSGTAKSGAGGMFAGGGGCATSGAITSVTAERGGIAAGGGGACSNSGSGAAATSGAGGQGLVVYAWVY